MTTRRPPSALGIFAFLIGRTTANMARRRLKRLREPRYLIGVTIGAAYFYLSAFRPMMRIPSNRASLVPAALSPEGTSVLLLMASLGLAVVAMLAWLFFKGTPRLDLKEADVQFLLPAPLRPRSVVHFSLLRSQLGLIFSSLIVGFLFGRGITPHAWQRIGASWIVLSTLRLHAMGLAFSKARWDEMAPDRRRLVRLASITLVILFAAAMLGWVAEGVRVAEVLARGADLSGYRTVVEAMGRASSSPALSAWVDGFVPRFLLAPFSALLAPGLSPDPWMFLRALPGAITVLLLHYFWVVRVSRRYEEAAIAGAQRSAERALRHSRGQITGPAPVSQREVVPFRLRSTGIPEGAIVWKNLLLRQEGAGVSLISPLRHGAGEALVNYGIPGALGLALFLPALAAAALVVQNGAVLAWPDWFPPGHKRAQGFEATGGRILSMIGTLLIAIVGLIPAALVGALVAWIGWSWLGAWVIVPAALSASIPVWAEAFAGALALGRLFESFDVSAEALE